MHLVLHFPWLSVIFSYVFENAFICSNHRWFLIASGHRPTIVSTHASYISRHRSKLRDCLTIYQMLRCTPPALQYPWCQEFWNFSLQNSYSYNHFFVSIRININHTSTRFSSLIFHFSILIVHVAPGSLLFTRAPILFFSSSLCFAAIFGHRSLFTGWILGMGWCLTLDAFNHILLLHA